MYFHIEYLQVIPSPPHDTEDQRIHSLSLLASHKQPLIVNSVISGYNEMMATQEPTSYRFCVYVGTVGTLQRVCVLWALVVWITIVQAYT